MLGKKISKGVYYYFFLSGIFIISPCGSAFCAEPHIWVCAPAGEVLIQGVGKATLLSCTAFRSLAMGNPTPKQTRLLALNGLLHGGAQAAFVPSFSFHFE